MEIADAASGDVRQKICSLVMAERASACAIDTDRAYGRRVKTAELIVEDVAWRAVE